MASTPETPIPAPVANFSNVTSIDLNGTSATGTCTLSGISIPGIAGCTYSCWVQSTDFANSADMRILTMSHASGASYELKFSGSTRQLVAYENGAPSSITLDPTPLTNSGENTRWYQICVTSTSTTLFGGTITLYVNGVSVGSGSGQMLTAVTTIAVSPASNYFYGMIDEMAIWDSPLTAAQVAALYTNANGLGGKASNINNLSASDFSNERSMSFDGINDAFATASGGLPITGDISYSYSVWIKPLAGITSGCILVDSGSSTASNWKSSRTLIQFQGTAVHVYENDANNSNTSLIQYGGSAPDTWTHYVVTSVGNGDPDSLKLYVNGKFVKSGDGIALHASPYSQAWKLGNAWGFAGPAVAIIDEFAVWNGTILTATEAALIYSGAGVGMPGNIASTPGLTVADHYWRLGDLTDTDEVVYDRIGSLNMAAISGPVTSSSVPTDDLKIWWRMGDFPDDAAAVYPATEGYIYNAGGFPSTNRLEINDDVTITTPSEKWGPASDDRFQITTPENSGTGLIPRVLNQKSVTFDGIDQSYSSSIGVGPDFTVSGAGMTLNCNVKLNSTTGTQPIFGQANIDTTGTYTSFFIYMVGTTLAAIAADSASGDWATMGIVGGLSIGVWYTVTVTLVPGGNMTGYVWGNQYGTPLAISAGFGATWSANRCWSIGAWRYGAVPNPPLTDFSNVQVDECVVFDEAWPSVDIIGSLSKAYYRPDWSTPPVDYTIAFKDKLGYPKAWWRMGDTTDDSATQMLDAVFSDTKSMVFDGIDDFMATAAGGGIPVTSTISYSVSLWVKFTVNSGGVVLYSGIPSQGAWAWRLNIRTYALPYWNFLVNESDPLGYPNAIWGTELASELYAWGDFSGLKGWTHLVVTSEGDGTTDSFKVYVNAGTPTANDGAGATTPQAFPDSSFELRIAHSFYTSYSTECNIDEVGVWHGTVLTPAEVGLIYNGGTPKDLENTTGLTAPTNWWRMGDLTDTDGAPGVVYDRIGSYNLTADDGDGGGAPLKSTDVPALGNVLTGSGLSASDIQDEIPIIYLGVPSGELSGGPYFAPPTIITPIQVPYVNPVPIPTGVSPSSGPVTGDTTITIAGTNFVGVTTVTVGGIPCTSVTTVSAISITAVTPVGTAGAKDIVITASGGFGTLSSAFTYMFDFYSMVFDGIDDFMATATGGGIPVTSTISYSVSLWVKFTVNSGGVVLYSGIPGQGNWAWRLNIRTYALPYWNFLVRESDPLGYPNAIWGAELASELYAWGDFSGLKGWTHLVVTSEGDGTTDSFKVYVNAGTPTANDGAGATTPQAFPDSSFELRIAHSFYTSYSTECNIDEVGVWHGTVLTPAEVGLIYNGGGVGKPGDLSNTVGLTVPSNYWRMGDLTDTDGAPGVVYDREGSSNLTAGDGDGGGAPLKSTDVP